MKPQGIADQALNLYLVLNHKLTEAVNNHVGEDDDYQYIRKLRRVTRKADERLMRLIGKYYRTVESSVAEWSK